ncbi:MAG: hypothetical protein K2G26_04885, partial [Clostridia bacterium]|nr:hypothetical protein [Clostridia bacterium]
NEINGLNSLYTSLLDFLSVAELGVGSAITFCMYKPIVEGETQKVSALYGLFTKLYLIVGGIILVAGCALMPALPYLAKDYQSVDVNLYLTFGLMLASVVISYVFSAKTSLINAYKNNYITTTISSTGQLLQCVLQIIVLIYTRSFIWFLACRIFTILLQWGVTELIARKKYGGIIKDRQKIDKDTRSEVTKSIKAMFMHKIGGVLVNTADSLIISAFIGIVILGKYSNYSTIMVSMTSVLTLCFTPLTSVIGHMCVSEDQTQVKKYLNFFHTFNFLLGMIFFLGYYSIIDNLVTILFGPDLELIKFVSFVITVNYFIQFMRQTTLLFRDATGTFYYDRWKPLIEGVINVGLSIGFVYLFNYLWGENFAVVGVIVATIITNVFICHIVEPRVLYKYALKSSPRNYYLRNYLYMGIFVATLVALHFSMIKSDNQWVELFANGFISLAFSLTVSAALMFCNKDFRHYFKNMMQKFKRRKNVAAETLSEKIAPPPEIDEAQPSEPSEQEEAEEQPESSDTEE